MCLQLGCLVTVTLGPGLVGSLSSEQTQVPDRLSFDQNTDPVQAQLTSRSAQLKSTLRPSPFSKISSAQVQLRAVSGSGSDQVQLS